eukprot:1401061-Amphidinium_carterae.1
MSNNASGVVQKANAARVYLHVLVVGVGSHPRKPAFEAVSGTPILQAIALFYIVLWMPVPQMPHFTSVSETPSPQIKAKKMRGERREEATFKSRK